MNHMRALLLFALTLALCACQSMLPATPSPIATQTAQPIKATLAQAPTSTNTPAATLEAGLPAEPQEVSIPTQGDEILSGRYYPAAQSNAPLVIFVHWVKGDMNDWNEVAVWLQNRGQANPYPNPGDLMVWDVSWFPAVPEGRSYAVLTFSLHGCQPWKAGCKGFDSQGWYQDVQAVMDFTADLPGIDPDRIVLIGASIGADGAADGCAWLNRQRPGACKGALSLSPGSYLTVLYPDVVKELSQSQPPVPAWCLADEKEIGMCRAAGEYPSYKTVEIPQGQHGTLLLRPGLAPLPMQLILDFLAETLP